MRLCGYKPESVSEGEGLRAAIYISGCRHRCPGCFSEPTWDFEYGESFTLQRQDELITDICSNPLLDGITLLGGDPFFSAAEVALFVDRLQAAAQRPLSCWAYSGFTYEQLSSRPGSPSYELLRRCDVLVDGRYEEELRDVSLPYCGSSNQRIIRVQDSLAEHSVVLWQPSCSWELGWTEERR